MLLSIVMFIFTVTISATPLGDTTRLGISKGQLSCDQAKAELAEAQAAYIASPDLANMETAGAAQQNQAAVSFNPQYERGIQLKSME